MIRPGTTCWLHSSIGTRLKPTSGAEHLARRRVAGEAVQRGERVGGQDRPPPDDRIAVVVIMRRLDHDEVELFGAIRHGPTAYTLFFWPTSRLKIVYRIRWRGTCRACSNAAAIIWTPSARIIGAHRRFAFSVGWSMAVAGLACILHGLVPAVFTDTASRTIRRLHAVIERREAHIPRRAGPARRCSPPSPCSSGAPLGGRPPPLAALALSLISLAYLPAYWWSELRAPRRRSLTCPEADARPVRIRTRSGRA